MADDTGMTTVIPPITQPKDGKTPPPPTLVPLPGSGSSNDDNDGAKGVRDPKRGPRRRVLIASATALLVLLAGGGAAYGVTSSQAGTRLTQAETTARQADQKLADAIAAADRTVDATKATDVKDANTLDTLKSLTAEAVKAKGVPQAGDTHAPWAANAAADAYEHDADEADDLANRLGKAVKAVEDSAAEKKTQDAKATLQKKLTTARTLLKNSNGKVADNRTRQSLQKAIDQAAKTTGTADAYARQSSALDKAMKTVNDSVKKKTTADRRRAEAARRAAQSAGNGSNASSSGSGAGSGSSGSRSYPYSGGSSSNGGYSGGYSYNGGGSSYSGGGYSGGSYSGGSTSNGSGSHSSGGSSHSSGGSSRPSTGGGSKPSGGSHSNSGSSSNNGGGSDWVEANGSGGSVDVHG